MNRYLTRLLMRAVSPCILGAALLLLSMPATDATAGGQEPILIIANNGFPVDSLSATEIRRIFKKEQTRVGGAPVIPIHARQDSALRNAFVTRALEMNPTDELSYWQDQKVQAGKQPPAELANTVRGVFALKGGISYCFQSEFRTGTAKILLTL